MKIAKKIVRIQSPLVNPIIDLERPFEKVLKKGDYVATYKFLKTLDGQHISMGLLRYMFIEHLLTGDMKATFNLVALDIGIRTFDDFNKIPDEMTKHAFPAYTFC